jgi:pyruvate kinase
MRRAKIVATLGPATRSPEAIKRLIQAGTNVVRVNLSHGDVGDHEKAVRLVRAIADELKTPVGVLADLQGPKIRTGTFAKGQVDLIKGNKFTITTQPVKGDENVVSTTYAGLPKDVRVGDFILLDDGRLKLEVVESLDHEVVTEVIHGGVLSNNKGINLPGVAVGVPALSEKDTEDLRWALKAGCDWVALSFVRRGSDVEPVREIMAEVGVSTPVIAKIEKPQAVAQLEQIIESFDAIMIARGDLGIETPLEQLPLLQKRAINLARLAAKPVIVATQMLESMLKSPQPSRSDVSDIANAVLDGADALMLSGETSVGEFADQAVATMARIIEHVEESTLSQRSELGISANTSTERAVTRAAVQVAKSVGATYLATFTETGRAAQYVAMHRSPTPLLAFTPDPKTLNRLTLVWGCDPQLTETVDHTDDMVEQVDAWLLANQVLRQGELVVLVAGVPPGVPGTTNGMRVHRVGTGRAEGYQS